MYSPLIDKLQHQVKTIAISHTCHCTLSIQRNIIGSTRTKEMKNCFDSQNRFRQRSQTVHGPYDTSEHDRHTHTTPTTLRNTTPRPTHPHDTRSHTGDGCQVTLILLLHKCNNVTFYRNLFYGSHSNIIMQVRNCLLKKPFIGSM